MLDSENSVKIPLRNWNRSPVCAWLIDCDSLQRYNFFIRSIDWLTGWLACMFCLNHKMPSLSPDSPFIYSAYVHNKNLRLYFQWTMFTRSHRLTLTCCSGMCWKTAIMSATLILPLRSLSSWSNNFPRRSSSWFGNCSRVSGFLTSSRRLRVNFIGTSTTVYRKAEGPRWKQTNALGALTGKKWLEESVTAVLPWLRGEPQFLSVIIPEEKICFSNLKNLL